MLEDARQGRHQTRQILVVLYPIGQADIERATRLVHRVVVLLVHGEREHARVAFKEERRPVAVVDVEIDHRGARRQTITEEHVDGHCDVVEQAKPLPVIRKRVVQSAAGVTDHRFAAGRRAASQNGPARHQSESVDDLRRPGYLEERELLDREGTGLQLMQILRRVDERQILPRRWIRVDEPETVGTLALQPLDDAGILQRREDVRADVDVIVNGVEDEHRHTDCIPPCVGGLRSSCYWTGAWCARRCPLRGFCPARGIGSNASSRTSSIMLTR